MTDLHRLTEAEILDHLKPMGSCEPRFEDWRDQNKRELFEKRRQEERDQYLEEEQR